MKKIQFPFPVFISKEGKWFVAECPLLGVATQGKTEKELRENMKDLIQNYFTDPDIRKDKLKEAFFSSFTYIHVFVSEKLLYGKA